MAAKVRSMEAMAPLVAADRAAGRRVVVANGAFDLLHAGHVRFLAAARAEGDVLVVAVNDDAAVRAAKGPLRPVQPLAERLEIVSALAVVDHVVAFSEPTLDTLLERLRPDVHAKGEDYDEARLPEAPTDRRLGIRMAFVGGAKEGSSSLQLGRLVAAPPADRPVPIDVGGARGFVERVHRARLESAGLLDLGAWIRGRPGEAVEERATRAVRRVVVDGAVVYAKTGWPAERGRRAIVEYEHHLALRSAGFRCAEPWLALEGRIEGRPAGVLVLGELAGPTLDDLLGRGRLPAEERRLRAIDLGRLLRALHVARFLPPDLHARHLVVVGPPGAGPDAWALLDVMRLPRGGVRLDPRQAARGLLALDASTTGRASRRDRLRVLRTWLGGTLRHARPWLRRFDRLRPKLAGRSTYRARERTR